MSDKKPRRGHTKRPQESLPEAKNVQEAKFKFGRYRPELCEMLIDHMSKGHSFESFGGLKGVWVGRSTLYNWTKEHPEFETAREIGQSARLHGQESQLMMMSRGIELKDNEGKKTTYHPKHGKPQFIQWMMKCQNPDIYMERKEVDLKSSDGSMTPPTFIYEEVDGSEED